jgi:GNAT superfamily N-acetyltransferase
LERSSAECNQKQKAQKTKSLKSSLSRQSPPSTLLNPSPDAQIPSILAPYRSLSLGTALLESAIEAAKTTEVPAAVATKTSPATAGRKKATKVQAFAQEGNDDAKRFYVEKGGFKEVEL